MQPEADRTRLLHAWSTTWAKAALRTDKGKPTGLFPASLRWPDAAFNGDEPTWHRANMFWRYFDWRGDGMLYDQLLCSWLQTHDDALLEPLRLTLELLRQHPAPTAHAPPEGSVEWAAARLRERADFWSVVAQWRLETGDSRFDSFLRLYAPPYLRFRLSGDREVLTDGIARSLLETLRTNAPMRTTEVLFTDRVHVSRDVGNWDGIDLIVAMLTGNHAPGGLSPYYHVAWEGAPSAFTALVTAASQREFAAELFLHQPTPARLTARLFRLQPGPYHIVVRAGDRMLIDRRESLGADARLTCEVPGGILVRVGISAAPPDR